jgi:hypothetical protein
LNSILDNVEEKQPEELFLKNETKQLSYLYFVDAIR